MRTLRVAVFAANFPPAELGGGPIRTISALVSEAPEDQRMLVLTSDRDHTRAEPLAVARNRAVPYGRHAVWYASTNRIACYGKALRWLRRERPDIVYLNSFFSAKFSIVPRLLAKVGYWRGAELCIAPRGEFDAGALALKAPKKRVFVQAAALLRLDRGTAWHASSEREAEAIRQVMGAASRVLVRENETALPARARLTSPQDRGTRRLSFVGRLSPKKGVDTLIHALRLVRRPVQVDVYGPWDDMRYRRQCLAAVPTLPEHVRLSFHGAVAHAEVVDVFADSDAFLFPTRGENFGHVIAEALSVSCPVAVMDVTPWTERIRDGAGWVVGSDAPAEWAALVDEVSDLPRRRLQEIRRSTAEQYDRWRSASSRPNIFALLGADARSSTTSR